MSVLYAAFKYSAIIMLVFLVLFITNIATAKYSSAKIINDKLTGTEKADRISGGRGNDTIVGLRFPQSSCARRFIFAQRNR